MAQAAFKSVDEYLAAQPAAAQRVLRRVRTVIRKALPTAAEILSYKIPAYRLPGGVALFFAGWKAHYSLYPATAALVATFKRDLAPYDVNDKGTIRFPLAAPIPVHLISALARFRAQELAAEAAPSKTKKKVTKPKGKTTAAKKTAAARTSKRSAAKRASAASPKRTTTASKKRATPAAKPKGKRGPSAKR